MELSITELRAQRRPLWMSYLGAENFADFIGGGGDIWFDRLPLQWERSSGEEIEGSEAGDTEDSAEETAKAMPN